MRQYEPLAANYQPSNRSLDDEQRKAVEHILSSRDFVTLFRGGAGTGKSFTLREVKAGLKASRSYRSSPRTTTPAGRRSGTRRLYRRTNRQCFAQAKFLTRGAVVIVDEAGQIGGQQMLELLSLIQTVKGRVILSGDTHQHEAVEASDALRAIEQYSGLGYAELTNIRRQNPDRQKHGLNANGWNNTSSP
jgi:ATP-dependent exoDNAse (exonuclease V) alpha subunit